MKGRHETSRGVGLLEAMVALVLLSIVGLGLAQLFSSSFRAKRHVELRTDLEALRQLILTSLDCTQTLSAAGIDVLSPGTSCQSTSAIGGQSGPFLRLRRQTMNGSVQWLTPALGADGSALLGGWNVRASCSEAEQTLVIRAARLDAAGGFYVDPLTKRADDWAAARSLLFGVAPGAVPICFSPPNSARLFMAENTASWADLSLASVWKDVPGLVINNVPATAGSWLKATFSGDYFTGAINAGGGSAVRFLFNGTQYGPLIRVGTTAANAGQNGYPATIFLRVGTGVRELPPGTYSVKAQYMPNLQNNGHFYFGSLYGLYLELH